VGGEFRLGLPLVCHGTPNAAQAVELGDERGQRVPQAVQEAQDLHVVWGLVLLADAGLRLAAVLVLSVTTAATAATVLTIATVLVLVGWLRFYLPRRLRSADWRATRPS
jgi:hypothetical protein